MAKMTKDQLLDAIAEGTQVSKGAEVEAWQKRGGRSIRLARARRGYKD
jgi:hypothetical protein